MAAPMGGIGKGAPGKVPDLMKPVTDVTQKAAKAQGIKAVKLKIKFGKKGM